MLKIVLVLIAISAALLALPLTQGHYGSVSSFLDFYTADHAVWLEQVALVLAGVWLAISLLALWAIRQAKVFKVLIVLLIVMAIMPLLSLFGPKHYIGELGGFPMLGSGQGVIKYVSLLILAISLLRFERASRAELFWLNYLPVAMVLGWIGSMKFYAFEAQGIVDLVQSSPLLSWLYLVADIQTASNLIGIYDLLAALLLGLGFFWPRVFVVGFLMAFAVFATTQTFLISYAGAWQQLGILSGSGAFIIKDLWFIANMLLMAHVFYHGKRDA